jgi:3-deoxy-manno-octulosonate cytidylyltransferase (CMP-KDO synthetase)
VPAVAVTRLGLALTETSVLAVIPARYHSTRLPGKPLLDIAGRPMIEHVYRRASAATAVDAVLVATDDERIARAVEDFGGTACMTATAHRSATDRLAEVAETVPCGIVVNVQGDEPLLDPAAIDAVIAPLREHSTIEMSTAARPLTDAADMQNPHVVKVVLDHEGFALYFSRAPIPYDRDGSAAAIARVHIGLYGYRRDTLLRLAQLPPTPLECAESLEQLRALEHGIRIKVIDTAYHSIGVDTAEDLDRVRRLLLAGARG